MATQNYVDVCALPPAKYYGSHKIALLSPYISGEKELAEISEESGVSEPKLLSWLQKDYGVFHNAIAARDRALEAAHDCIDALEAEAASRPFPASIIFDNAVHYQYAATGEMSVNAVVELTGQELGVVRSHLNILYGSVFEKYRDLKAKQGIQGGRSS